MNIIRILGLASLIGLCSSCETVVEVDIPQQEPVLVVFGFISPNEQMISFTVRASEPIFSENSFDDPNIFEQIDNAEIWLGNGVDSVLIAYDESAFNYAIPTTSFPIEAGRIYSVRVSAPGYKTVHALTRVPNVPAQFTDLIIEDVRDVGDNFESSWLVQFRAKWQDDPSENNFYIAQVNRSFYAPQDFYLDDENRNGSMINERLELFTGAFFSPEDSLFGVYLLNVSEEMYLYKRSMENITYGDPFSEPTIIYSNVVNGLGCFGSYYGDFRTVNIE